VRDAALRLHRGGVSHSWRMHMAATRQPVTAATPVTDTLRDFPSCE
jgi:hypothetical protein